MRIGRRRPSNLSRVGPWSLVLVLAISASTEAQTAPTVTSVTPGQAYNYQQTTITISGTGFQATPTVTLNSVQLTGVTLVSNAILTAIVPAKLLPGAYPVTVTNPGQQSATLATGFTVQQSRSGALGVSKNLAARPCAGSAVWNAYVFCFDALGNLQRGTVDGGGGIQWDAVGTALTPTSVPAGNFPQILGIVSNGSDSYVWALTTCTQYSEYPSDGLGTCSLAYAHLALDGSTSTWGSTQLLLNARRSAIGTRGRYLYLFASGASSDMIRFPAGNDGAPGPPETLQSGTPLSTIPDNPYVVIQDYVYALSSYGFYTNVSRARFNADGTVTDWVRMGSSQLGANGAAFVIVADGHVYVTGAIQTCNNPPVCTVGGARTSETIVFADGSLGTWRQLGTPLFPAVTVIVGARTWLVGAGDEVEVSPMAIAAVTPSSGSKDGCNTVTVTGSDLLPAQVAFGGVAATNVVSAGFQTLTATTPAHLVGAVDVVVTNLDGRIATLPQAFTYADAARLSSSPTALFFGAINNNGTLTPTSPTQTFTVSPTTSCGTVNWSAIANQPWITLSTTAGTGAAQLQASVANAPGIPSSGTLTGAITFVDDSAAQPLLVPVTLQIHSTTATAGAFGSFDTPVNGATVRGSIAVTGWALDDIGIDRVEIWRDLVAGETTAPFNAPGHPGHGKVFIANTLFVPGARPDVEATYPTTPLAYRAGWGYLLLTWGLWNQGTGPFTLYAFAFDKDGHATTLGTKAITSSNSAATKPFGAIDVPAYGQTMTTSFWNYGWALTPQPNSVDARACIISGGNVLVGIDSGPLLPVSYGGPRTDIAGYFPGLSNATAAGGAYYIDISTLTNGTHQIGWYVVDSCGRADGIGSRFFTVAKTSLTTNAVAPRVAPPVARDLSPAVQADTSPVLVRNTTGEWTEVPRSSAGVYSVSIGQSDRLELQLPTLAGALYTGAQVVNGEMRALPLGSSLDAERGIFYWQPAAGFLGGFDLVFISGSTETKVRVVVGPSMRMAIDTPTSGGIVQQPFTVAGWALDLAAADGAGIDTVHVWAYPAAGGDPIFLGVADSGDSRPDVAETYGGRFERSSFSLMASGLRSGAYNVVVYAHRASTGSFDGAQSVRAIVP